MPELSDRAAKDFLIALNKVRADVVNRFIALKDTVSAEELRQIIVAETKAFVFNNPKFSASFDKLIGVYGETLDNIKSFATVSAETLQGLIDVSEAEIIAGLSKDITAIQKEIFNASLTNQWNQKTIINNLQTGVYDNLSEGQINTLIDTSLSTFERNVTTGMMEQMPPETLYIYVGPLDSDTRDICNEMISAGSLTEKEIIEQFGSEVLSIGGGFNCRHKWDLDTAPEQVTEKRSEKSGELLEE